jgi:hypothetical protein
MPISAISAAITDPRKVIGVTGRWIAANYRQAAGAIDSKITRPRALDWVTLYLPVRPRLYRRKHHIGDGRFRRILYNFPS